MAQGKTRASQSRRPARKGAESGAERIKVGEHAIEVRGRPGIDEQLLIDGERRQFFVTSGGYRLLDDAYRPAEKTLAEAARKYVERQAAQNPPGD